MAAICFIAASLLSGANPAAGGRHGRSLGVFAALAVTALQPATVNGASTDGGDEDDEEGEDEGGADAAPSAGAARRRPRSIVFRPGRPNARGFHTIHIECMPNSGCTLFAEFLCGQLLGRGANVACFPDIFDCTALVPRRADEASPRTHHYVAKVKTWPMWGDAKGREVEPPPEIDRETSTLRAWSEVNPTVHILFMRDPLQNYLSLRKKPFCSACGGMRSHFAALDRLFSSSYEPYAAQAAAQAARIAAGANAVGGTGLGTTSAAGGGFVEGYAGYWDAVLFAEDMAEPTTFLDTMAALLGREAVGTVPDGVRVFGVKGWQIYQHKRLAAHNAALGYAWAGIPVNGSSSGRYYSKGKALRFGSGNSRVIYDTEKSFYSNRPKPATRGEQALATFLAPRMAAAYSDSWEGPVLTEHGPLPSPLRPKVPGIGAGAGGAVGKGPAVVAQVGMIGDTIGEAEIMDEMAKAEAEAEADAKRRGGDGGNGGSADGSGSRNLPDSPADDALAEALAAVGERQCDACRGIQQDKCPATVGSAPGLASPLEVGPSIQLFGTLELHTRTRKLPPGRQPPSERVQARLASMRKQPRAFFPTARKLLRTALPAAQRGHAANDSIAPSIGADFDGNGDGLGRFHGIFPRDNLTEYAAHLLNALSLSAQAEADAEAARRKRIQAREAMGGADTDVAARRGRDSGWSEHGGAHGGLGSVMGGSRGGGGEGGGRWLSSLLFVAAGFALVAWARAEGDSERAGAGSGGVYERVAGGSGGDGGRRRGEIGSRGKGGSNGSGGHGEEDERGARSNRCVLGVAAAALLLVGTYLARGSSGSGGSKSGDSSRVHGDGSSGDGHGDGSSDLGVSVGGGLGVLQPPALSSSPLHALMAAAAARAAAGSLEPSELIDIGLNLGGKSSYPGFGANAGAGGGGLGGDVSAEAQYRQMRFDVRSALFARLRRPALLRAAHPVVRQNGRNTAAWRFPPMRVCVDASGAVLSAALLPAAQGAPAHGQSGVGDNLGSAGSGGGASGGAAGDAVIESDAAVLWLLSDGTARSYGNFLSSLLVLFAAAHDAGLLSPPMALLGSSSGTSADSKQQQAHGAGASRWRSARGLTIIVDPLASPQLGPDLGPAAPISPSPGAADAPAPPDPSSGPSASSGPVRASGLASAGSALPHRYMELLTVLFGRVEFIQRPGLTGALAASASGGSVGGRARGRAGDLAGLAATAAAGESGGEGSGGEQQCTRLPSVVYGSGALGMGNIWDYFSDVGLGRGRRVAGHGGAGGSASGGGGRGAAAYVRRWRVRDLVPLFQSLAFERFAVPPIGAAPELAAMASRAALRALDAAARRGGESGGDGDGGELDAGLAAAGAGTAGGAGSAFAAGADGGGGLPLKVILVEKAGRRCSGSGDGGEGAAGGRRCIANGAELATIVEALAAESAAFEIVVRSVAFGALPLKDVVGLVAASAAIVGLEGSDAVAHALFLKPGGALLTVKPFPLCDSDGYTADESQFLADAHDQRRAPHAGNQMFGRVGSYEKMALACAQPVHLLPICAPREAVRYAFERTGPTSLALSLNRTDEHGWPMLDHTSYASPSLMMRQLWYLGSVATVTVPTAAFRSALHALHTLWIADRGD